MKHKILVFVFLSRILSYTYGTDSSTQSKNKTVKICKYSGAVTGALIGACIGYILRQKMEFFAWNHSGLDNSRATTFQFAAAGAADGLIEFLCQWGPLLAGYKLEISWALN